MRKRIIPGLVIGSPIGGTAGDLAIFALASAGTYFAQQHDRPITAVLAYLIGVIGIGARSGLQRGLLAAIAASLVYNFFLSEPVFRFGASSLDEIVPLLAFNVSAILTGALVGRLKDNANAARRAEAENALLLTISDRLQKAIRASDLENISRPTLSTYGVADLQIYAREGGRYHRPAAGGGAIEPLGLWLPGEGRAATNGTFKVYELSGTSGDIGVVRFQFDEAAGSDLRLPDLQPFANLLALALDRCMLLEELAETRTAQRTEELKSAILSSVSHDLRTPLTAIEAAASSLRSYEQTLAPDQKDKMLATIAEQCKRLNRYTSNLLDMGRIQSGISSGQFSEVDVVEILGVVLGHVRQEFPRQAIEKSIDCDYALVHANGPMLEQAIANVMENAVLHGAADEPLRIRLAEEEGQAILEITDGGAGIARIDQPRIFDRFYRSDQRSDREGSGLGLYIAKGFVEAFGGSIGVASPVSDGKGTRISIRLPLIASAQALGAAQ